MKNTKDLKIIGIDSARPPKIRKEPYIDLVFKLSDRAHKDWCQVFNMFFTKANYSVRIDTIDCMYIETWVRTMDEIPKHLEMLKAKVSECNQIFLARQAARVLADKGGKIMPEGEEGAQGLLNEIVANLNFD